MRRIKAAMVWFLGAGAALGAQNHAFDDYVGFNRRILASYTGTLSQDVELGHEDGTVLRGGLSTLAYDSNSMVFAKAGLLLAWNFDREAFALVPHIKTGVYPVFAGVSCPLADRAHPPALNYELGVAFLAFEGKVVTKDFKKTAFFFSFCLPANVLAPAGYSSGPPEPQGTASRPPPEP